MLSGAKIRSHLYVTATAFREPQPPLYNRNLPRPISLSAEQRNLHRLYYDDPLAGPALDPKHVVVPCIILDCSEPLLAHGLRRIAQTRAEIAVMTAARPTSAAGSRTSMATFRFVEGGYMFTFCSV